MLSAGDIILLEFPYTNQLGSKVRPALVIGHAAKGTDVQVAYITAEIENYSSDTTAEIIDAQDMAEGVLRKTSLVRADKLITLDATTGRKVGRLTQQKIDRILRKVIASNVASFATEKYRTPDFIPGQNVVPPSGKVIGRQEQQLMVEASLDGWLTTGRFMRHLKNGWENTWVCPTY